MSIESITPANPAQVMDAMVEAFGLTWWGRSWPIERSAGQDIAVRSALEVALTAAIGARGQAVGWRDATLELPPIEQVVLTRRASAYDGADIYAFGARVDSGEGWLWGASTASSPT